MAEDDEKVVEPEMMVPTLSMMSWEPKFNRTQDLLLGKVEPVPGDPKPWDAHNGQDRDRLSPGRDA